MQKDVFLHWFKAYFRKYRARVMLFLLTCWLLSIEQVGESGSHREQILVAGPSAQSGCWHCHQGIYMWFI